MNIFNETLCHSVKSKNCLTEQCSSKQLLNNLCGKHSKSKKIILYNDYNPINLLEQCIEIPMNFSVKEVKFSSTTVPENNVCIENKNNIDNKIVYNKDELFDIIQKNKNISVFSLRKSIKNCNLNKFISTKLTKPVLINEIKKIIEKERFYVNNLYYIIQIQRQYKKWSKNKRLNCFNDTDILTFDSIYEIPNKYFYVFYDKILNKRYGYDIRTLIQIIYSDNPSCPYTFRLFTDDEKIKIYEYKKYLESKGVNLEIEKRVMTEQEEIDMKIKDVFYQINMLDNYTNPIWFKNLSLQQLVSLYINMEDIWCYRTAMTIESKKNIIRNGIAFNIPMYIIKSNKSLIKMQHVLLDEFTRLITEGINREERKLGAILILSGLVEVSPEASYALPHLVQ